MAKQTFTTGQVLTAAQMTSLQQTAMLGGAATAKVASYTLVAADAGTAISMSNASATTITVNTGLFAAGDTVFIQNIGAGACTITAGTATVATAGSLILPQNDAGILYFTATGTATFYDFIQAGAVSPLTTKGDLYTFSTSDARLAVGNNGETLVADSSATTGLRYQPHIEAGKNFAINGGMDIWQRGTSSSGNAYNADRWYSALVSGTGTFAQETTVIPTGSLYSQKFTASATAQPALYQAVETLNAVKLQGQTVVLSALVAASTSTGITLDVQQSSSTDVAVTGSFTSITATSGGTATPTTTTFVPITGVYVIPSTAKSLRIRIFTTSTIASSVVVYFANIQMEVGSIATAFSRAGGTIQGELAACQRYYFRTQTGTGQPYMGVTIAGSSTQTYANIIMKQTMRTTPTVVDFSGLKWQAMNDSENITAASILDATPENVLLVCTTTRATTAHMNYLIGATSAGYVGFSAEL